MTEELKRAMRALMQIRSLIERNALTHAQGGFTPGLPEESYPLYCRFCGVVMSPMKKPHKEECLVAQVNRIVREASDED